MGALNIEDLPHYTYDDYILWQDNWEIIYGQAYAMSPAPMIKHQKISNNIAWILKESLKECTQCTALLPVDWKITNDTIVQPDNSVICHTPKNPAYIEQAPELIFEILSKSTASKDTNLKFKLYEQEGVKYYIIVNPEGDLAKVYEFKEGRYIKLCDTSDKTITFHLEHCSIDFNFSKIWN